MTFRNRTTRILAACAFGIATMSGIAAASAAATDAPKGTTLQKFEERRSAQIFKSADKDNDGRISKDEFMAARAAGKGDPEKRFMRLDANKDGYLDKQEINAMLEKRFHRLDTNGDGVISKEERTAARDKMKQSGQKPATTPTDPAAAPKTGASPTSFTPQSPIMPSQDERSWI